MLINISSKVDPDKLLNEINRNSVGAYDTRGSMLRDDSYDPIDVHVKTKKYFIKAYYDTGLRSLRGTYFNDFFTFYGLVHKSRKGSRLFGIAFSPLLLFILIMVLIYYTVSLICGDPDFSGLIFLILIFTITYIFRWKDLIIIKEYFGKCAKVEN